MLHFYKRAVLFCFVAILASVIIALICVRGSHSKERLLGQVTPPLNWWLLASADSDWDVGGNSSVVVNDDSSSLDFDMHLMEGYKFPYTYVSMMFGPEPRVFDYGDLSSYNADLSGFNALSFRVKCFPDNILFISIDTMDHRAHALDYYHGLRPSRANFSCSKKWTVVNIDFITLDTPEWWLEEGGLEVSYQEKDLSQAVRLSIGNTNQTPLGVQSKVQIEELTLHGRVWWCLYVLVALIVTIWGAYLSWLFRAYSMVLVDDLTLKSQKEQPLMVYPQLSKKPARDRMARTLLDYLAKNFVDPDLQMETVVKALNINRTTINNILREELDSTLSVYINKLRVSEAARLLRETEGANVSEIAYAVGFNNVSYFNKLFKAEFGCTPKMFKKKSP